jgi:iron complex transport system substrate-binding protein
LSLCTDEILIDLVEPARIAAVTQLAADPAVSVVARKAQGIARTRSTAEDVLRLSPDLVLAGPFGARASVEALMRLGVRVLVVPQAQDLAGVRTAIATVAAAVAAESAGRALIAEIDRRLAQLPAPPQAAAPTALLYQPGGEVSARGSLAEAMLAAAGFRNKAASYPLSRAGQVSLEVLLADPPDLLILARAAAAYRTPLVDNLRHPALSDFAARHPTLELPWRLWLCGSVHSLAVIEELAAARARLAAERR